MRHGQVLLWGLWTLFSMMGCQATPGAGDDESTQGPGLDASSGQCATDNSQAGNDSDPDWQLVPGGEAKKGNLCPKGDTDHFWFQTDSPRMIARVSLSNHVQLSPIDLCYQITPSGDQSRTIANLCDSDGMDGPTELSGAHFLADAGKYLLVARDEGGDDEDRRNPYQLSLDLVADPDTYEPNNDKASAKPLSTAKGYVSYLGDRDWYRIAVSQPGQLVSIQLVTDGKSGVIWKLTLYKEDGTSVVNTLTAPSNQPGAVTMRDALAATTPGTYYLVVEDAVGKYADVSVGYQLTIDLASDPDERDRSSSPNNSLQQAVRISSGATLKTAYLAARGDEDWYLFEQSGISESTPGVLELEVKIAQGSAVNPSIDVIVADPATSCKAGDPCKLLNHACSGAPEVADAQCPSFECLINDKKCHGAETCLPSGFCGMRALTIHGADWSPVNSERHLKTAIPLLQSPVYLLVRDFQSDAFDKQNPYELTATYHQEKDVHEKPSNGVYLPYATNAQEDATHGKNFGMATPISGSGEFVIEGYLSYRGDQDWYRLDSIPANENWDLEFPWSFSGNPKMEINYTMYLGHGAHTGFVEGVGSGTWGTSGCTYICGKNQNARPAYLSVMHKDRKQYDFNNPYRITVRVISGCPSSCQHCVGDGYCIAP